MHLYPSGRTPLLWRRLAPAVVAIAALAVACSPAVDPNAGQDSGENVPEIAIAIASPKADAAGQLVLGNKFVLSITATAPSGVAVTSVKGTLPNGTDIKFTGSGKNWSAELDTTTMVAKPIEKACGKKASIQIAATGTKSASGSGAFDFDLDHCAPTIELTTPKPPGPGEPKPVFIGRFTLAGKVSDPKLKQATISYTTDLNPEPVQLGDPLTHTGVFERLVDRTKEDSATVTVLVKATDQAGNTAELKTDISVLRQPSFLGNTDDVDQYPQAIDDVAVLDVDGDAILDEVIAGKFGVILRKGLPSKANPDVPAGEFQGPQDVAKNPIGVTDKYLDKKITVSRILPTHLMARDASGEKQPLDLIAAGTWDGKPALMALVLYAVQVKQSPVPMYGYRVVQVHEEPEEIHDAVLADLDADGVDDVVAAMGTENTGILTVLMDANAQCMMKKDSVLCDSGDLSKVSAQAISEGKFMRSGDHQPLHKGVAHISSIAVGDFYGDAEKLNDVCVGDSARPYVTCYENTSKDGSLQQGEDAFFSPDTPDTKLILKVEWTSPNGADGPDLIVGSSKNVRWLKGQKNGTFVHDPAMHRTILGFAASDLRLANVGPLGDPYLVMVAGGREVTVVPLAADNDALYKECFRTWLMGGSITKTSVADFDNDGTLDMLALDQVPHGTHVYRGLGAGDFRAPRVHHMCYDSPELKHFGSWKIVEALAVDLVGDGKPDIVAVGELASSLTPGLSHGYCQLVSGDKLYFPVWPWHAWFNTTGLPVVAPRAIEFNPNDNKFGAKAGVKTNCQIEAGNAPTPFGKPRRFAMGDVDGDKVPDIAVVREDSNYYVGEAKPPQDACGPCKKFASSNEYANIYGDQGKDPPNCCKIFFAGDTDMTQPLKGFGGGAPLSRASLFVMLAGPNKDAPLGFDGKSSPVAPISVGAGFAQAAGVEPMDVAIADLNGDQKLDIAVVMAQLGTPVAEVYFAPRLRIFFGEGQGKFKHGDQKGDFRDQLNDLGEWIKQIPVEYRRLYGTPTALFTAPYGNKGLPGLFAVEKGADQVDAFMSAGTGTDFMSAKPVTIGGGLGACSGRDVNGDGVTDLLCASTSAVGFLKGLKAGIGDSFEAKTNLVETNMPLAAVEIGDVNKDGRMDLIVLDSAESTVRFFLGDGADGFAEYTGKLLASNGVKAVQAVDFNKDGCTDLMVTSTMGITVLRNLSCDTAP